jgi:hypothetical protein
MSNLLVRVFAGLVEANEAAGAAPEVAFVLAFAQVMKATRAELELLAA